MQTVREKLKRAVIFLIGGIVAFALLEATLRATSLLQKHKNREHRQKTVKTGTSLTIMCIGESVTAGINAQAYPDKLEQILKKRYPGKNIKVLNDGVYKSTSYLFAKEMDFYAKTIAPDIVIAMLGINDVQSVLTKKHIKTRIIPSWFSRLKTVYLFKSLFLALMEKQRNWTRTHAHFDEKLNQYWETGTYNYFYMNDYSMLDHQMLHNAATPFEKSFWLARIAYEDDSAQKALTCLLQAAHLNPENPDVSALAAVFLASDPSPENTQLARKILSSGNMHAYPAPEDSPEKVINSLQNKCHLQSGANEKFYYLWGRWHHMHGFTGKAADAFAIGSIRCPEKKLEFEALWADTLRKSGNNQQALEEFEKILKQDPANLIALRGAAYIYSRTNPGPEEIHYLKECIKHYPNFRDAYETLGIRYYQEGKTQQARVLLEKAMLMDPYIDSSGTKLLTQIYEKTNNPALALNNQAFINNYRKIFTTLEKHGIKLIAMQYPMRNIATLEAIFTPYQKKHIIFADNTPVFEQALENCSYDDLFIDTFAGDFGHLSAKGAQLAAQTAAAAVGKILATPAKHTAN